jgi:pectate lyase
LNLPQSQNQLRQNNSSNHKSTQIDNVRKKNKISVAIVNNRAFWVHNNTFYTSEVIEGVVDGENAIPIDAYQLSPSEISLLMNVLDEIND